MRGAKMRGFEKSYNSALAQLVEQMTVNHWVAGSSPAGGAKQKRVAQCAALFSFYMRRSILVLTHNIAQDNVINNPI